MFRVVACVIHADDCEAAGGPCPDALRRMLRNVFRVKRL
jgi:hypothetical protein